MPGTVAEPVGPKVFAFAPTSQKPTARRAFAVDGNPSITRRFRPIASRLPTRDTQTKQWIDKVNDPPSQLTE
jgi:hypothetical protein